MIKDLEFLPYFTLANLALYLKGKKNAGVYASNWMKNNEIIRIRGGTYVSQEKFKSVSVSGEMGGKEPPISRIISENSITER